MLHVITTSELSKDGKKYLFCEERIPSSFADEFIQFILDPIDGIPVLPAYSTLRNSLVDVSTISSINDLVAEDLKYMELIPKKHLGCTQDTLDNGKAILTVAFD